MMRQFIVKFAKAIAPRKAAEMPISQWFAHFDACCFLGNPRGIRRHPVNNPG
jgi:hypothetical protein